MTQREQSLAYHIRDIRAAANTDLQSTEIRMSYRHIHAQIADPAAMRAVRVAQEITLLSAYGVARSFGRGSPRQIFYRRVYLAFRHGLLPSNVSKLLHNISSCVCYSLLPVQLHP